MAVWTKIDDCSAYAYIEEPVKYMGKTLHETEPIGRYIEKWIIKHGYSIRGVSTIKYNETATTYEVKVVRYHVVKYGIMRTIHVPNSKENIKLYLDTFNQYIETLKELKELKNQ